MDAKTSYPLVCLSPEQGTLVPISASFVGDDLPHDSEHDRFAWLWRRCCQLVWLLWLALIALRRLRGQVVELRQQAHYWQAQHQRAVQREAKLAEQVHQLNGEIRDLKRRLFGRKSETSSSTQPPAKATVPPNPNDQRPRRSRGQQPGSKGHGRRNYDQLPTTDEACVLPAEQCCCAACGQPFEEIPGSADGDILEIDIRAHRRRYQRQRYRRH